MQDGILDPKLPHQLPYPALSVQRFRQSVMLTHYLSLLRQTWRVRKRFAFREQPGLLKNPGIANGSSGNRHTVNTCLFDHVQAILGRKQITAAKDNFITHMLLERFQKLPLAWPHVTLFDRSAMNRDRSNTHLKSAIENPVKIVMAFLSIIDAAPHFDCYGNFAGHIQTSLLDNLQSNIRLT